jgi:hypothetical protein
VAFGVGGKAMVVGIVLTSIDFAFRTPVTT